MLKCCRLKSYYIWKYVILIQKNRWKVQSRKFLYKTHVVSLKASVSLSYMRIWTLIGSEWMFFGQHDISGNFFVEIMRSQQICKHILIILRESFKIFIEKAQSSISKTHRFIMWKKSVLIKMCAPFHMCNFQNTEGLAKKNNSEILCVTWSD